MICPKCNFKLVNGCCVKCGYLSNGNQVKNIDIDKNEDLKLYNKNFYALNQNKNLLLITLLGPLYFSYMGYFFIGTILGILDFISFISLPVLYNLMFNTNNVFSITSPSVQIYIIINRLIYILFANYICLLIDKIKVNYIKKKYKDNYKEKLKNYKHKKYYLLLTLLVYVILILIFIISRRIKNGLM